MMEKLTLPQFAHKYRGKTIVCRAMGREFYGKIWGYGIPNENWKTVANKHFLLVKPDNKNYGFPNPTVQDPRFVLPTKSNYRFYWIEYDEQTKFKIMKEMV